MAGALDQGRGDRVPQADPIGGGTRRLYLDCRRGSTIIFIVSAGQKKEGQKTRCASAWPSALI